MKQIIFNFLMSLTEYIPVVINMTYSALLGIGIFIVYSLTRRKVSVSGSFTYTLILLPLVSCMLANIIISNVFVLAVGMLGALSIIRFRHSMKEAKNLVFVFWAITAGIACGLAYRTLTVIWCVIIAFLTLAIHFLSARKRFGTLSVRTSGDTAEIENIFQEFSVTYDLKYKNVNEKADVLYELKHKKGIKEIIDKIMLLEGVCAVRFIEMQ